MRAKSEKINGYTIYAVSGTNTISFAIDFREANTIGLLGFAVERIDSKKGERKFLDGYKVFKDIISNPDPDTVVNTYTHPVQSFVWDDFTCYDGVTYEYLFYPVKGTPQNLDRSEAPNLIKISTEPLFSNQEHDVFFNRGVASSQAYSRKFFNLPPDKITNLGLKQKALDWLSRELDEAILRFIGQAKNGDTLLGCFYEFHYEPVVQAFKDALNRGVKVKLILDAKNNEHTDKNGKFHKSFPKVSNLEILQATGISIAAQDGIVFQRTANKNAIQHNKFIVLLKGATAQPKEVWTGSTNISNGGIHGQTNVGHWIRNTAAAAAYSKYWDILSQDPGGQDFDDTTTARKKNNALKKSVEALQSNIQFTNWNEIAVGITPVFSPRTGSDILDSYVKMFDSAACMSCITLAFGINKAFKDIVLDNNTTSALSFMLLEKEDKPKKDSKTPFVFIGAKNNVYKAWGNYLRDDLYNWARETSTLGLGLNKHVAYIHSKFLLVDPLSSNPVVVTGSANFSEASTNKNDENMVIIRGNKRVADIYFTEFNRIFNHYYFRAVYNNAQKRIKTASQSIFLEPTDVWLKKYEAGNFRYKRVDVFSKMEGF